MDCQNPLLTKYRLPGLCSARENLLKYDPDPPNLEMLTEFP